MRRRLEDSVSTYTILSNCEGGGVIFDGREVGTISGGKCVIKLKGRKTYAVSVNGGLPSDTTYSEVKESQYSTVVKRCTIADLYSGIYIEPNSSGDFDVVLQISRLSSAPIVQSYNLESFYSLPTTYTYDRKFSSPYIATIEPNQTLTLNYKYIDKQTDMIVGAPVLIREQSGPLSPITGYGPLRIIFDADAQSGGDTYLIDNTYVDFKSSWEFTGANLFLAETTLGRKALQVPTTDTVVKWYIDDTIYVGSDRLWLHKEFVCTSRVGV